MQLVHFLESSRMPVLCTAWLMCIRVGWMHGAVVMDLLNLYLRLMLIGGYLCEKAWSQIQTLLSLLFLVCVRGTCSSEQDKGLATISIVYVIKRLFLP